MEASNLPDTEFKALDIRMLREHSENFNKEIVSIKNGYRSHFKKETIRNEEYNN